MLSHSVEDSKVVFNTDPLLNCPGRIILDSFSGFLERAKDLLAMQYAWSLLTNKLDLSMLGQNKYRINHHVEMAPDPSNRVMLSEKKDLSVRPPLGQVTRRASERELTLSC